MDMNAVVIRCVQGVGGPSVKVFSPDELKDRLRRQLQMEQQVVEQHV